MDSTKNKADNNYTFAQMITRANNLQKIHTENNKLGFALIAKKIKLNLLKKYKEFISGECKKNN